YQVDAKIVLENEDKASGELAGLGELASLTGGGSTPAFVSDQNDVLKCRRWIRKVTTQQNLSIRYFVSGKIKSAEILEKSSPVKLVVLNPEGPQSTQELLLHLDGKQLVLTNRQTGKQYKASFGKPIQLEGVGQVLFESNLEVSKDHD